LAAKQVPGGCNGKILRVNLSDNRIITEAIDEPFYRKYLGGAGLVAHFLLKELPPGTDPLDPDNKLIFALGPVTGILLPGSDRYCVGAKSPLTEGFAKSESGGYWGSELKRAGYDAIIIEGKAEKPVYLWIHDGKASIRDAGQLWGNNTKETQETIRTELGDNRIRVVAIGAGGENTVRYACIMNGLHDALGRGGLGAVMGSKNLKAIAVRGHKMPGLWDPESVKELRQWLVANMPRLLGDFHEYGTGGGEMEMFEATGNLPVRNFRDGLFPGASKLDFKTTKAALGAGMEGCFACPVRCKKVVKFEEPYSVDPAYGGPEYETLAALGSDCGIDNFKAVTRGNELCNAYSLDTISTGGTIAFAMECFENGLLSPKDTNGLELRFGNEEAMLKLIELIARREGIGDLLAEGTARAAQRIGKGAEEFAIHVKGLEAGMHEPRCKPGKGLGYMVNPHGADHVCNLIDPFYVSGRGWRVEELKPLGLSGAFPLNDIGPRKVELFKAIQLKCIVQDSLLLCSFLPYSYEQIANLTAAVTGWHTSVMEHLKVAERTLTMARLFNIREGFTSADDKLPKRFFQPKNDGVLSNTYLDPEEFEKAKSYYYTLMGWDAHTGIPLPKKLEELGILWAKNGEI